MPVFMAKVRVILVSLLTLLFCSCERDGLDLSLSVGPSGKETRQVLLFYEAGFNSLSYDIHHNINVLKEGYLPGKGRNEDVVLVFSHLTLYSFRSFMRSRAALRARAPAALLPFTTCASAFLAKAANSALIFSTSSFMMIGFI